MNRIKWLSETLKELLLGDFFLNADRIKELKALEQKVANGEMSSFQAADELYKNYKNEQ